MFRGAVAITN